MMRSIFLVFAYLLFILGCSKSESNVFGVWKGDNLKMEFFDDHTGMLMPVQGTLDDGRNSSKFKWTLLKDGKVKIDTGRDDFIVLEMKDDQLKATVSGAKFQKLKNP